MNKVVYTKPWLSWEEFYQTVKNKPVPIGWGSWYSYWQSKYGDD